MFIDLYCLHLCIVLFLGFGVVCFFFLEVLELVNTKKKKIGGGGGKAVLLPEEKRNQPSRREKQQLLKLLCTF